jgi:glutamate racemase
MQNCSRPIGVFDSGVGGLTVLRSLIDYLPNEQFIYFADSANAPYGQKNADFIIQRGEAISKFFIQRNAKMIVVACNTATSVAIEHLRERYQLTFVGMEPAVKPASLMTKTGEIGVLATVGTLDGKLFNEKITIYGEFVNIHYAEGLGLVELAESNQINTSISRKTLTKLLEPMLKKNIDQLVLGCTHYPLFSDQIKKIVGESVNLIDPADAIARRVKDLLIREKALNIKSQQQIEYYTNGDKEILENIIDILKLNSKESHIFQI